MPSSARPGQSRRFRPPPIRLLPRSASSTRAPEFSITYLPTRHLKVGANYAYLWATNVNQTASGVYTDYNGFVPDGSTIVNNGTSSVGAGASVRGNYRVLGIPLNSANGWASYEFDNGFGLKASAWITSPWQVTRLVTVPTQYNLDLGAFYTVQKWRFDLTVQNVTDRRNGLRAAPMAAALSPISCPPSASASRAGSPIGSNGYS